MRRPQAWLIGYLVLLTAIAFWPVPVDSGAGPLLRLITRILPMLTYHRIEFSANILLFVPFGLLVALLLPRRRYLVLPIAIIAAMLIESTQGVLLGARTASLLDIVANTTGACAGLLLAELIEWRGRARDRPRPPLMEH
ncbi:VanZ family protein [Microbacterium sp.]|uniref:VanZ family protein n=1 Tax=Microbacterium sp. TaxID=51671 RepID=UPI003C7832AB